MSAKRVFLAGEGSNELGTWAKEPTYRNPSDPPGVLEALLRKVTSEGWEITDGMKWSAIRKLTPGKRDRGDAYHVRAICFHARERDCDVVVFSRDRDGARYSDRATQIEDAIREEKERPDALGVVGGIAIEKLESWVLAIAGERKSESYSDPESLLNEKFDVAPKDTRAMVSLIEEANIRMIPNDAVSLLQWIKRAENEL